MVNDVSRIEELLQEDERIVSILRRILNSTRDGILAVYQSGHQVIWNQVLIQMWKIPLEITTSSNYQEILTWMLQETEDSPKGWAMLSGINPQSALQDQDQLHLNDGRIFECQTEPLSLENTIVGRVWHFRDITEQVQTETELRQQSERERLIGIIAQRIRQSLNLEEILNTTVHEVRQFLETDRVLLYQFLPDWSGKIAVESVGKEWMTTVGMEINDPCFSEELIEPYQQGRIHQVTDIYRGSLNPCYVNFLSQLQVRANLAVPILQQENLWGLLLAHHCRSPRQWQEQDVKLLQSLATQVAIAIQQSSLFERLERANQELQRLASVDGLTQIANRRRFDQYLEIEWRRLQRSQQPLSLILCDVDYFKSYNDTYGHLAGDFCLQQLAKTLAQSCQRTTDLVARYGGEEFGILLPQTDTIGAIAVANKIRENIHALQLPHRRSLVRNFVTVSLGIASGVPSLEQLPQALITTADQALYEAKSQGRDRILFKKL